MSLSGVAKFFTGFVLAIAVLFFAGVSTTRYLIARFTTPPPRPTFPNDLPAQADPPPAEPPVAAQPNSTPSPPPPSSPTPSPTPSLEPGAYEARVTQPIGLILRQSPNRDAEQIGGIEYNEQVIVLSESSDGEWLQVRLSSSGVEGWVKSGNTERLN